MLHGGFDQFFERAVGSAPHPFQARMASHGLPEVLEVPPGAGKTGIVLAWLWRRLHHPDEAVREATPRRLIFALPMRGLAEQVASVVEVWLRELELGGEVALHVVMGGAGESQHRWRMDAHHPAVVVGTIDSLVSKALLRGYGISRNVFPMDFALVTSGAHWVLDEVQLCGPAATTLRQVQAFARDWGTAEPLAVTYMTATVPWSLLDTVDNPRPSASAIRGLSDEDRQGELGRRLAATRVVGHLAIEPDDAKGLATRVAELHRPGTRTLVVHNTVKAARATRAALGGLRLEADLLLLHSRFRAEERRQMVDRLIADVPSDGPGRIIVATQVVEAGIDVDAATLVTDVAPWSSVVQRAGRCNRYGRYEDAQLWWITPKGSAPYGDADLKAATEALVGLEARGITTAGMLDLLVEQTVPEVTVLRRRDMLSLFDTAPDLSGTDIDVAPYIRDNEDLDVQLAWTSWEGESPPRSLTPPEPRWRCPVPIGDARAFAKKTRLWRLDQGLGRWLAVTGATPPRPGEVLVVHPDAGGYDVRLGWDPAARQAVAPLPSDEQTPAAAAMEEAYNAETATTNHSRWMKLDEHLYDVERHADALISVIRPELSDDVVAAVTVAGLLHDIGKAHPAWQDALCALALPDESERVQRDRPWAKSPSSGRLRVAGAAGFRHEFVSLLLLLGQGAHMLDGVAESDLVRYLVAAHHGRIRVQARDPNVAGDQRLLGLTHGDDLEVPQVLDTAIAAGTVDLEPFSFGGDDSWTRTALSLRDRFGPFRLAYLEALVRIADWRASAEEEVAT